MKQAKNLCLSEEEIADLADLADRWGIGQSTIVGLLIRLAHEAAEDGYDPRTGQPPPATRPTRLTWTSDTTARGSLPVSTDVEQLTHTAREAAAAQLVKLQADVEGRREQARTSTSRALTPEVRAAWLQLPDVPRAAVLVLRAYPGYLAAEVHVGRPAIRRTPSPGEQVIDLLSAQATDLRASAQASP